jgi:beta-glucosidase
VDHYRRVVDALISNGIRPVITLYHWDLPQVLEDEGGWTNRDTAARFAEYANVLGGALGDADPMWITLNEPWVAAWLGYGTGEHAPGRHSVAEALAASHHLLLAHGLAVDALRAEGASSVGIALNLGPVHPATDGPEDAAAADLTDAHLNRQFLDPLFGRDDPSVLLERYQGQSDRGFVLPGDLERIARPLDFLGVNFYSRHTVSARPPPAHRSSRFVGDLGTWGVLPDAVRTTAMGWGIEPHGLTELLVRLDREYPKVPLYITENGAAFDDYADPEGRVEDLERVDFLRAHLVAAADAIAAGVDLRGYFVWSIVDNFEWAVGYSQRFGLVHVDYETLKRTPKDSFRWYGELIRAQR